MVGCYKVVTLCGSTRFKEDFIKAQRDLTLQKCIVLSVGMFGDDDSEPLSEETKAMLDDMHKRKIDLSDAIFVINREHYIGKSTQSEIDYATRVGKSIGYMFK